MSIQSSEDTSPFSNSTRWMVSFKCVISVTKYTIALWEVICSRNANERVPVFHTTANTHTRRSHSKRTCKMKIVKFYISYANVKHIHRDVELVSGIKVWNMRIWLRLFYNFNKMASTYFETVYMTVSTNWTKEWEKEKTTKAEKWRKKKKNNWSDDVMRVCVTLFNDNVFQQRSKTPTNELFRIFLSFFIWSSSPLHILTLSTRTTQWPQLKKKRDWYTYFFLFRYFVFVRVFITTNIAIFRVFTLCS